MYTELKENQGIPSALLGLLAVVAGISVANIYYSQPLLNLIRQELGITEFRANLIPMLGQAGYAIGLLFIIPLGDLFRRKRIIVTNFTLLTASLLVFALSDNVWLTYAASLFTGACSVIPQFFLPIAAQFSVPEKKERNVGIVLSGLLTGILASRVVSGAVGEYWGWREMYLLAAGLMAVCCLVVLRLLPDIRPTFQGRYGDLMRSLLTLLKTYPALRVCPLRAGLAFGAFMAAWACLAFKLGEAPFHAGSDTVGMLGLCGVAGAMTASTVGTYIRRFGVFRFNLIGCTLLIAAWTLCLWMGGETYAGLITGIIVLDIGMQCIQLSNQTSVFSICPSATNRINTIFMTTYFIGGSTGTFLAGTFWQWMGWNGTVLTGVVLASCSLAVTLYWKWKERGGNGTENGRCS